MSANWVTAVISVLCSAVVLYLERRAFWSRTSYPFPPGPPGLPWVGNPIGIDAGAPWKTYAEWARKYGDIVYCRLFGQDIVVINSEKIAKDLLENRSRNYSDRLYMITTEICGLDFHTALLPYGDAWRLQRRFFHQTFRLDAVSRFLPLQHRKACHLLRQLFNSPEQLNDHLFEYTSSVILNSTYDYDPASRKDKLVDMLSNTLNVFSFAARPDLSIVAGACPPLFRFLSWCPGTSFKRQMAMARAFCTQHLERPFEYSLQQVVGGSVAPSMVYDALRHMEEKGISPDESWMEALKEASGAAFLAASDTSRSILMMFFLMMVLNPTTQEKAQAQIDAVVGKDRLPTIDDRPLLPFVDAIFRETIRYCPLLPLSFPHAAIDDDVYNGFHIPKGALLVANVWSMAHDESKYPNPHAFIPERFLNDDGSLKPNEIENITYGFGRRICVGRHFADTSVWAVMAKVLTVFKISKALDENGAEIPVEPRFSSGIVIHPLPFGCKIVPRSPGMDPKKLGELIAASTP